MNYLKLKDICNIKKGKKVTEAKNSDEGVTRYIQIDDLRNNNSIKYCIPDSNYIYVEKKDIIIAWDGANAGTVGFNLEGAIGSTLAKIEVIDSKIFEPFLAVYLQSKFEYFQRTATGATIPHISRKSLENLDIPIYSLEEQKKIYSIINQAKQLILKRQSQISALDELSQSLFLEMFGDPIGNIKKWPKEKLGQLCEVVRGGSPRPIQKYLGGNVPWIKIGDGTKGDNIYINSTKEFIDESGISKSRIVEKGDVIFANCGVSLGFARIVNIRGCIHDGWLAFNNIDSRINKIFLLKLLNNYTEYFRKTAPEGTQPNLNTSIMKNFEAIIPPLELQELYEKSVFELKEVKNKLLLLLNYFKDLYNSLIEQAFKGELFQEQGY